MGPVVPPARNAARDRYVDEHDIAYDFGRMICQGVRWEYRIYYPKEEPKREYGTIGDIAVSVGVGVGVGAGPNHNNMCVWYRTASRWVLAEDGVHVGTNGTGIPNQKHPLLKGRYRLDMTLRKWRNATTYYMRMASLGPGKRRGLDGNVKMVMEMGEGNAGVKVEDGNHEGLDLDVKLGAVGVGVDLSVGRLTGQAGRSEGEKQMVLVDLSQTENEPRQKVSPLLPRPSSSFLPPVAANTNTNANGDLTPASGHIAHASSVPRMIGTPTDALPCPTPSDISSSNLAKHVHTVDGVASTEAAAPRNSEKSLLEELEDINFQYPEFGRVGMFPPRAIQEWDVQADGSGVEPLNLNVRRMPVRQDDLGASRNSDLDLGQDPDGTMHPTPITILDQELSENSAVQATINIEDVRTTSTTASSSPPFYSESDIARVQWLLKRLLAYSAKDRKEMLELMRRVDQRLERLEGKLLASSLGMTRAHDDDRSSTREPSRDEESMVPTTSSSLVTSGKMSPTAPLPTMTPTESAHGYIRSSLPFPKRYLKESYLRKVGGDGVMGAGSDVASVSGGAPAGVNVNLKRRVCGDSEGGRGGEGDEVAAKKSRLDG